MLFILYEQTSILAYHNTILSMYLVLHMRIGYLPTTPEFTVICHLYMHGFTLGPHKVLQQQQQWEQLNDKPQHHHQLPLKSLLQLMGQLQQKSHLQHMDQQPLKNLLQHMDQLLHKNQLQHMGQLQQRSQ